MRRIIAVLTSCVLLWSCDSATAPDFPSGDVTPFQALARYSLWWQQVEQCAGRTGNFASVHWFETDGRLLVVGGKTYDGYWWEDGNRIALVDRLRGPIVRHEMLHAILRRGDHPLDMFAGRCEGVVAYDAPESYGVDPAAAAQAKTMAAESTLVVTIGPTPAIPHLSQYEGCFSLTVTATNRTDQPIWVTLPRNYTGSFWFKSGGYGGSPMWTSQTRVFFYPGQQRRVVLDAWVDTAGTYQVRAGYAGATSSWTTIGIVP
ncbi:MAG TPA: hypothetical protein VFT29_05010 [Gemmatimonadaceae bacterium]|nr:hypothetical protein [Gemmatimonadaceae bacterium]